MSCPHMVVRWVASRHMDGTSFGWWECGHGCGTRFVQEEQAMPSRLDHFCRFLEKNGYLDDDWWIEKPSAIERYFDECDQATNGKVP